MEQAIFQKQIAPFIFFNGVKSILYPKNLRNIQEIRIRIQRPIMLLETENEWFLQRDGTFKRIFGRPYIPSLEEVYKILQALAQNSIYAYHEELKQGFITIPGGHRVGVVGSVVVNGGEINRMHTFTGLNFRFGREVKGCCTEILPHVLEEGHVLNALIVSPPGVGKTTLLRDLSRQLSNGVSQLQFRGVKVGVVDERYELSGSLLGQDGFDLGIRTDIIKGCPKAEGLKMLLRTMSPQVIITDEMGSEEDFLGIIDCMNAGVKIIASCHGYSMCEVHRRKNLHQCIQERIFDKIFILSSRNGPGTLEEVYDVRTFQQLLVSV